MKRIVSLVLALSMVLSMFSMSFAGTGLKDIENTKYEAAVEALMELKVVSGYPDGTFMPDNVVTRAELAKLLVVAYGLEPAAEASKGTTPFDDVNTINHWASGYINVSADYKFVNGYPDGSFKGDEQVTYAEAITMCLRVLGYANEIDSKGTWPTNYIAKAQDLKLMKDIDFKSYNDGAKRGDIAILIWNMLRTKMWTVTGETEGDGLASAPNKEMLNVKFPDYTYSEEMTFNSWYYNADEEKVFVSLAGVNEELEYAKNDFYTLVPGTEVSVLYKKDNNDKILLSIVATEDNVLVSGPVADLEEKYTEYDNSGDTYAYLLLEANKKSAQVKGKVEIDGANSEYVTKVEEKNDYTKVTTTVAKHTIDEEDEKDVLVINGEERLSLVDLEAGDVITWIAENVAVLSRKTEEGTFESLTYEEDATDSRWFIKLDGEEFEGVENTLTVAKVNEKDNEEFDDVNKEDLLPKKNDYLGEDAKLFFNFIDEVVRMEFGVVDASDVKGDFFLATTGSIWSVADEDGAVWYIKLANEEGTESYKFEEGKEEALTAGVFYWVEFNDDDEIEKATPITSNPETEDFTFATISGEIDKDTKYIGSNKVSDSTVVFTARQLEDEDGVLMNKYELVVTNGSKELEGIKEGTLALEEGTIKVAYAFVTGESTSADKEVGIVDKFYVEAGITYVVVDGQAYELAKSSEEPAAGSIIAYTVDSKDRLKVAFEYAIGEIARAGRVTDVDTPLITIDSGDVVVDLDLVPEQYEDYRVFFVEVEFDKDSKADIFDTVEEVELEEIGSVVFKKDFGMAVTKAGAAVKAIVIIDGITWAE